MADLFIVEVDGGKRFFIASLLLFKVPKEKHLGDINKKGRQRYSSYIAKQGVYPIIYVLICLIPVGQNPFCRFF